MFHNKHLYYSFWWRCVGAKVFSSWLLYVCLNDLSKWLLNHCRCMSPMSLILFVEISCIWRDWTKWTNPGPGRVLAAMNIITAGQFHLHNDTKLFCLQIFHWRQVLDEDFIQPRIPWILFKGETLFFFFKFCNFFAVFSMQASSQWNFNLLSEGWKSLL